MEQPIVSIVMAVYSEPIEWLELTIESVREQTFNKFEYIIVFDNPAVEKTWDYLQQKASQDERIRLLKNQENIGLTKSLNVSMQHVKGKYIARIDGDDIWHRDKLEKQIDYLAKNPDLDICGTCVTFIDEDSNPLKVMDYPLNHRAIGCSMAFINPIVHSSVMFKKEVLNGRHPHYYDETFRSSQDYALWADLYINGYHFANLPERLVEYRISSQQITKKNRSQQLENAKRITNNYILNIWKRVGLEDAQNITIPVMCKTIKTLKSSQDREILFSHLYYRIQLEKTTKLKKLLWLLDSHLCFHSSIKKSIKLVCKC